MEENIVIKSRARTRAPLNLVSEFGKENNGLDLNFESLLFTCDYSQYLVTLNTLQQGTAWWLPAHSLQCRSVLF